MRVKMMVTREVKKGAGAVLYSKGLTFEIPDDLANEWMGEDPPAAWKDGEEPPKKKTPIPKPEPTPMPKPEPVADLIKRESTNEPLAVSSPLEDGGE